MTVSVENSTRSAIPPTLQSRLDDALADAAGLEAALEDEQKKSAELEAKLNSVSSGVEHAEEYAKHNKKRNDEMGKLRRRLERRDEKIAKLEANATNHDDHVADLEDKIARGYRLAVALEAAIDRYVKELTEANDKIAVQAQELVSLREQLKEANAESAHNAHAATTLTQRVDALERVLESQHRSLTATADARGDIITEQSESIKKLDAQLQAVVMENARLHAAEYLHKNPSYVRGAISAVRAVGRLVVNRGGVR